MTEYYLAIDIGASSGRHILGHMEQGKMILHEIYRFENGLVSKNGELCWELDVLFQEILKGMKKCHEEGFVPFSVGIDTWAVDFVLLDSQNKLIGNTVSYRDSRTKGMDNKVYQHIPEDILYYKTGIQKQPFNTIYQLMAVKTQKSSDLEKAETMLMVPDYFNFLLSGIKAAEYTNATTTQMVSPVTKDWDYESISKLGYPEKIFQKIRTPGEELGNLTEEIADWVGYNCKVVLPATHDTGSAVLAVPSNDSNPLYISSGTWSLMGTERMEADCTEEARKQNFTNEGGFNYRFRYLKNIMGLWMIQCIKKETGTNLSYETICKMASEERITSQVSCNDERFLAPENMTLEVMKACEESGQKIPQGTAQVAAVVYNSLVNCYVETVIELEKITKTCFQSIHVIGGGANAQYLNQLLAEKSGKKVLTGPIEATAVGNIMVQMIGNHEFQNLQEARKSVKNSFEIKTYQNNQ